MGIAHRDARLADATQSFLDQPLVTAMKSLVTAEQQGRRPLQIEWRTPSHESLLTPVLRRYCGANPKLEALGRNEHPIGVYKAAWGDAIEPDRESFPKTSA